jgi:hypothetical protein
MTFGRDGNLYVSNFGFGAPAGVGQIVKVTGPRAICAGPGARWTSVTRNALMSTNGVVPDWSATLPLPDYVRLARHPSSEVMGDERL